MTSEIEQEGSTKIEQEALLSPEEMQIITVRYTIKRDAQKEYTWDKKYPSTHSFNSIIEEVDAILRRPRGDPDQLTRSLLSRVSCPHPELFDFQQIKTLTHEIIPNVRTSSPGTFRTNAARSPLTNKGRPNSTGGILPEGTVDLQRRGQSESDETKENHNKEKSSSRPGVTEES